MLADGLRDLLLDEECAALPLCHGLRDLLLDEECAALPLCHGLRDLLLAEECAALPLCHSLCVFFVCRSSTQLLRIKLLAMSLFPDLFLYLVYGNKKTSFVEMETRTHSSNALVYQ